VTADPRLVAILPGQLQPLAPGPVPTGRFDGLVATLLEHWERLLQVGSALVALSLLGTVLDGLRRIQLPTARFQADAVDLRSSDR
jgi:hypothetical protein